MAHIQSNDPFGFVGSHVLVHATPRKGRRRQRTSTNNSSNSMAMKPDPGAAASTDAYTADEDDDAAGSSTSGTMVLHGWVTRYDSRLDVYTLFSPATGAATLHPRGDLLQFVSNPLFQLRQNVHDDAFPPPLEDTRSRFVGAPMWKKATSRVNGKRRTRRTSLDGGGEGGVGGGAGGGAGGDGETHVRGRVVCFLPFADAYRVAFDDGSAAEMSERELVDALLAFAKRTVAKEEEEGEKEGEKEMVEKEKETEEEENARGRKRRRSEEEDTTHDNNQEQDEQDDEETEDEELPSPPPPPTESSGSDAAVKSEQLRAIPSVDIPPSPPTPVETEQTAQDQNQKLEQNVEMSVDEPVVPPQNEELPTASDPLVTAAPSSSTEVLSTIEDDAMEIPVTISNGHDDHAMEQEEEKEQEEEEEEEVPMELPTLDDDDEEVASPAAPEVISLADDDMDDGYSLSTPSLPPVPPLPPTPPLTRPVSYIVDATPHVATAPLDTRTFAFEFLRTELTRLVDSADCASLEIKLVADVLSNRDIKDRDAVRRFVETGGLVAINRVLNVRSSDALATKEQRYDRVLFVLKLLAMLPTPSEQQVMESVIGKTIGRFTKSRLTDQQAKADVEMPKCVPQLARWIKHKWVANMHRSAKPTTATSTTPQRSFSSNAANKKSKKHLQRPSHGRPPGPRQRINDPEPIPRLHSKPPAPSPPALVPPPVLSFANVPKSSLKPDWMRQKETLSRTRFTISTDANAERHHYQQRERAGAVTSNNTSNSNSNTTATTTISRGVENPGDRGVFGRTQRLSFGPRWNVCEFFKDAPPSAVRRVATASGNSSSSNSSSSSTSSSVYNSRGPPPSSAAPPKSILRRHSKYRDELSFGL